MKLLILCTVLSALLAVSLASPVKTQIRDDSNISDSSESSELNKLEKNSSSSSEEEIATEIKPVQDSNEKDISVDSSEEELEKNTIVQEEIIDDSNSVEKEEEQHFAVGYSGKPKRSVVFAPHSNNQLLVKDEGSIKYDKYLKLKRLRRAEESDESTSFKIIPPHILLRSERGADTSEEDSSEENNAAPGNSKPSAQGVVIAKKPDTAPAETLELAAKPDTAPAESEPRPADSRHRRNTRSAETSEEDSSEEDKHSKGHGAPEQSLVAAQKPDTAPAETLEVAAKPDTAPSASEPKPGDLRRRRSPDTSEEHNSSEEDERNDKPHASHAGHNRLKRNLEASNEQDIMQEQDANEVFIFSSEKLQDSEENNDLTQNNDENLEKVEDKNSQEDYAQGCGGSSRRDDSNENSVESNETLTDKL